MASSKKLNFYLYAAYSSTCLEDRAWSFCVSLCMSLLGGMQLVSIEQLAEGLIQMVLSGHLGKYLDGCSRKKGIKLAVPLNNLSIVVAALFFIACLSVDGNSVLFPTFLVLGIFSCAVNRLFLNAEKFLVGRDWVVILSKDNLADLNATLTALDQLANVFSPLITGGLVSLWGLRTTCAIFGVFSLLSMASKAFFLSTIYASSERLHTKDNKGLMGDTDEASSKKDEDTTGCGCKSIFSTITGIIYSYYSQTVFTAALGMALLFMTVLGFDGLAVGYGQSIGLPEALLGGFRSFGSAMGIAGALSYAFFESRLGVGKTGLLGLMCQQICVAMAVASVWLPGSPMDIRGYFSTLTFDAWWSELKNSFEGNITKQVASNIDWNSFTADGNSMISIFVFLIGIACARFGLWMADLSITHIMQVGVPEIQRNTVFGVHNALCQTFSVLKDLLVIILPDPKTFAICIFISYAFVATGHLCYVYYYFKRYKLLPTNNKQLPIKSSISTKDNISLGSEDTFVDYRL